jgi:hypothetical protein
MSKCGSGMPLKFVREGDDLQVRESVQSMYESMPGIGIGTPTDLWQTSLHDNCMLNEVVCPQDVDSDVSNSVQHALMLGAVV